MQQSLSFIAAAVVFGVPCFTGAAEDAVMPGRAVDSAVVLSLELRGVGQLSFGERFEWALVAEPPADPRGGEGVKQGGVSIRRSDGAIRHVLPEPPAYSLAENGPACTVVRVRMHAVIRCLRDYVFNLETGAPPVALDAQFNDRVTPLPWLLEMPLPWWRETGYIVPGTNLLFVEYGWTNYGQAIESTPVLKGPALLDLDSGGLAIGYVGDGTATRVYDAAADERQPNVMTPERVLADRMAGDQRIVTVLTAFDSCAGAFCRSEADPGFRRTLPVTYRFESLSRRGTGPVP